MFSLPHSPCLPHLSLQRDRIAAAGVTVRVMRRQDVFNQRAVYDIHQDIQACETLK